MPFFSSILFCFVLRTGVRVHGIPGDDGRTRQDAAPERPRRYHAREGQRGARGGHEVSGDEGELDGGGGGERGEQGGGLHWFSRDKKSKRREEHCVSGDRGAEQGNERREDDGGGGDARYLFQVHHP